MKNHKRDIQERNEVVELYNQGLKLREIAEQTCLPKGRVSYIIYNISKVIKRQRHYNVSIKEGKTVKIIQSLNDELVQRIKQLTAFGYDPNEIAQDVGVTKSKVLRVVNELKESNLIKMRV